MTSDSRRGQAHDIDVDMDIDIDIVGVLSAAFSAADGDPHGDPDSDRYGELRARLAAEAERDGLLDLAYRTVESPFGSLLLVASPDGLVRIAFEREGHDVVLAQLAGAISPRILRSPRRTDRAARQLDEYFAGRRRQFDVPVDLQLVHGFRRTVISHLREISYGKTESYAAVARAAGHPAAVRAVRRRRPSGPSCRSPSGSTAWPGRPSPATWTTWASP
jgi:methylated-DNA-[protein]-cysteine S-methyltransferase